MHFANTPKLGQVCPIRIRAFQTGWKSGPFTTFLAPRKISNHVAWQKKFCRRHYFSYAKPWTMVFISRHLFISRTTKYLKKASLTRTCAIGGFFLSIPLFLIGECLSASLHTLSLPPKKIAPWGPCYRYNTCTHIFSVIDIWSMLMP